MPNTGGYSSREAGWRTVLQGKRCLVRSVIKSRTSNWERFPVEQAGQKCTFSSLYQNVCGRLLGLFHLAFAFATASHLSLGWHHAVPPFLSNPLSHCHGAHPRREGSSEQQEQPHLQHQCNSSASACLCPNSSICPMLQSQQSPRRASSASLLRNSTG